jgi:hypothetical protein
VPALLEGVTAGKPTKLWDKPRRETKGKRGEKAFSPILVVLSVILAGLSS